MRYGFFLFVLLFACGGRVGATDAGDDLDGAPEGGRFPHLPDGAPYVDPMCPDAGPPPIVNECDVLDPLKNCPPGTACYPVTYPPMEKCDTERYGSACLQQGTGTQGEACGSGSNGCAPGFVCVITGGTTECAKACKLGEKGQCGSGYVCEPIDVPGYAVCL